MRRAATRLLKQALQGEGGLRPAAIDRCLAAGDAQVAWACIEGRQLASDLLHPRLHSALAAPQPATQADNSGPAGIPFGLHPTPSDSSSSSSSSSGGGADEGSEGAASVGSSSGQGEQCQQGSEPPGETIGEESKEWWEWRRRPEEEEQLAGEVREGVRLAKWPASKGGNQAREAHRRFMASMLHKTETCADVLALVSKDMATRQLGNRELSAACSRMGRIYGAFYRRTLRVGGDEDNNVAHCSALFELLVPHFHDLDSQGLATAAWMCARFHYMPPPEQREAWEVAVWTRREDVNLIETANIMFSLGVIHWAPGQELVEHLIDTALKQREGLTPWMVCNMIWGCARLSEYHPGPERLMTMVEVLLPQLPDFEPESFCSLLFSLACLRVRPDDAALTAILDAFEMRIPESNNRQLVTIVWALGALGLGSLVTERLWERVSAAVQTQEEEFNFSSTPFFLFGAARLQLAPSDELMEVLLRRAFHFQNELRTGDVSVILWSLVRLGHVAGDGAVSGEFVQAMAERFASHHAVNPASLRQCCAFLFSCAMLKHPLPPQLLDTCTSRIDVLASAASVPLSSTDASMLLSAFEAYESVEGLALLRRLIMGGGVEGESPGMAGGDLDMGEEMRPKFMP